MEAAHVSPQCGQNSGSVAVLNLTTDPTLPVCRLRASSSEPGHSVKNVARVALYEGI